MSKSRIMYIEFKGDGGVGPGRIGRLTFSKSGRSIYYQDRRIQSSAGMGIYGNYFDAETGDEYWVSGCRKDGNDALYPSVIEIDADVAEEYWTEIRGLPADQGKTQFRSEGKHGLGGRHTK